MFLKNILRKVLEQSRLLNPVSGTRAFLSTRTVPLGQQAEPALDRILTQTQAHRRHVVTALAFQMFFKMNVNATIFVS